MGNRLDLSWDSIPCDGASAPVASPATSDVSESEYDDLLRAWCQERHQTIETKLYLDEALRLIKRLVAEGSVSLESRKRARRLFAVVRDSLSDDHREDEGD